MYDYPLHHFVDLSDEQNGCAVIVSGLKEYEILDDPQKTIAITLITCVYFYNPAKLKRRLLAQKRVAMFWKS